MDHNNIIWFSEEGSSEIAQPGVKNASSGGMTRLTEGFEDKTQYFVDTLALGISKIAASSYPNPVIVRMSDFKTNEYALLIGSKQFEPKEANPMLGWRGASRYYSDGYREGFALECRAMLKCERKSGCGTSW